MNDYFDSSTVKDVLESFKRKSFVGHAQLNRTSTYVSLIFKTLSDIRLVMKSENIKATVPFGDFELVFKNNLLEILIGLYNGVPMYRAQRTLIESTARLFITLHTDRLLNEGKLRTSQQVRKLENAISTTRVYQLTKEFSDQLSHEGFKNVADKYKHLYKTFNNPAHANTNIQYPEYLIDLTNDQSQRLLGALEYFQEQLQLALFCLLFSGKHFVNSALLSREDFSWISNYSPQLTPEELSMIA